MEQPPVIEREVAPRQKVPLEGSTSCHEPDVVERASPSPASRVLGEQKRKRSQVVPCDVIEIDEDGDSSVLITGESSGKDNHKHKHPSKNKYKQVFADKGDWLTNVKVFIADDLNGLSLYHGLEAGKSSVTLGREAEFDFDHIDDTIDGDVNLNSAVKFSGLDLLLEVGSSEFQDQPYEGSTQGKEMLVDKEIDLECKEFKQFDIVKDYSDHHFAKQENIKGTSVVKKPSKNWTKKIQHEWKILEEDLPGTIFVRVYEERMDLLRAVIVGPAGTPYHDGLFFFDCFFPSTYPNTPPHVYYHSAGVRLNPNLYACGKVCLSLLGTWSGHGCEKWNPTGSTMLQILVSIQALVLNAKPYFNEPGFSETANTTHGEMQSLAYNENTFLLSCKTMLHSMRKPPKNFEDFVDWHFRTRGRTILVACRAYMDGAQVGCVDGDGVQDVDEGDKSSSSSFQVQLKGFFEDLLTVFMLKGADCAEFLEQKINAGLGKPATVEQKGR